MRRILLLITLIIGGALISASSSTLDESPGETGTTTDDCVTKCRESDQADCNYCSASAEPSCQYAPTRL